MVSLKSLTIVLRVGVRLEISSRAQANTAFTQSFHVSMCTLPRVDWHVHM